MPTLISLGAAAGTSLDSVFYLRHFACMKTYQIFSSRHSSVDTWVIKVVRDGKVSPGTVGNSYKTQEDAQYWVDILMANDRAEETLIITQSG